MTFNSTSAFAQFGKGTRKRKKNSDVKCVIYTRVSSQEQASNTSLETQIEACRNYARTNGFEIVSEFGGTYESAKSDEGRKEFKRMLDFIKIRRTVTQIVVYSLDRFSRTGPGALAIIEDLKGRGVSVHAVTQPADTDTAVGQLMQQVNLIFSNYDNNLRRDKTVGGMLKRMQNGYYCGTAPHGYVNTKIGGQKVIVPDGKKSKLIRKAFKWKAEERISNEEVRERLKARGWDVAKQTLSRLFKNPVYCGLLAHNLLNGELLPGKHEPLVSQEMFLAANDVNAKFFRTTGNDPEKPEVSLKAWCKCEKCQRPLRGYIVKAKGLWYYKCPTKGCGVNRNADKVHTLFLDELRRYSIPEEMIGPVTLEFESVVSAYFENQFQEVDALRRQRSEFEDQLDTVETKYVLDKIGEDLFQKHSRKIKAQIATIDLEIERTGRQVSNLDSFVSESVQIAANLAVLWENGDYRDRQRVQTLVFPEGMTYDKENDKCRTFRVSEIFRLIHEISQKMGQKKMGQTGKKTGLSHSVRATGLEPAPADLESAVLTN